MSNHVIYLTEDEQLKAETIQSGETFQTFVSNLKPESILYINGQATETPIPEQHKEVYPIFLKSMQKRWANSHTLFTPTDGVNSSKSVSEENVELVVEDTPKKRTRKKK